MTDTPQQPETGPSDADQPRDLNEYLVAYLDGELSEAAVREVEQQLARDPNLRRNAEAHQKAWELLDELPHMRATDQFTTKTIASLNLPSAATGMRSKAHSLRTSASVSDSMAINTAETGVNPAIGRRHAGSELVLHKSRSRALVLWFGGLALSALAGFLLTNRLAPSRSERLLRDLPVIERWDDFEKVGSLEFLKQYRELKTGGAGHEPPP